MKLLYRALVIAFLASCFPAHDPATIDRSGTACVNCHLDDYNGTPTVSLADPAVPDHVANATKYPQTCGDCHNTQTWYSHPEALFLWVAVLVIGTLVIPTVFAMSLRNIDEARSLGL